MKRRGFLRNALASIAVALEVQHWAQAEVGVTIDELAKELEPVQTRESLARGWTYHTVDKVLTRDGGFDFRGYRTDSKKMIA